MTFHFIRCGIIVTRGNAVRCVVLSVSSTESLSSNWMEWRIQTDMTILKLVWGQHWFSFIALMVHFDLGRNSDSFGELRRDKTAALPWWERSWRGSTVIAKYHGVFMRSVVDLWRARRSPSHKCFQIVPRDYRHHYHHNNHSKQLTNTTSSV